MSSATPSAAPWRSDFLSHLETMKSPEFVLSTLHPSPSEPSEDSKSALWTANQKQQRVTPRARTVIFRGMWACMSVNSKNPAELNPSAYESDLPTLTADVRMEKIPELLHTGSESGAKGSPVEAVFWAVEPKTQWRLRGNAFVVGPEIDSDAGGPVRAALEKHMRRTDSTGSWSWGRELTAHFGNLSPGMRGSFRNPPPGTPVSDEPGKGLKLGQKVEDLQDKLARENFRVLVIVPDEVDRVDLTDPARGRRWIYKLDGQASWNVTELWP